MRSLGVIKERDLETRVALVPEVVAALIKDHKISITVEKGAGDRSGFSDQEYLAVGATIADSREAVVQASECVIAIDGTQFFQISDVKDRLVVGLFDPFFHQQEIERLKDRGASVLAVELIPRISRAQSMDVLSSQANIAGYAAVLLAASKMTKIIPLMMTAAGTIKPAKILIIGAGVAGLQAIATAKRLGALVFAYDVRPQVKEQVESLGAKFVEIKIDESGEGQGGYAKVLSVDAQRQQREKLADIAKDMDVVITTAQIPGKKAPLLLDERIFTAMKRDAVIVDLAASSGGNVPGSVLHEWTRREHVWLYGAGNLATMMPKDASFTFAKNIRALIDLVAVGEDLNSTDEIIAESLICHRGNFMANAYKKNIGLAEK